MSFVFQFTPLREGRRRFAALPAGGQISIHAPPRGATGGHGDYARPAGISIHAPPRGATPPPTDYSIGDSISIHAPPRGATAQFDKVFQQIAISIHAPPRGATICWKSIPAHTNFNSRPSARGDRLSSADGSSDDISIHAPPRGATKPRFHGAELVLHFNSRPSARGDYPAFMAQQLYSLFQFTPLREGRRTQI